MFLTTVDHLTICVARSRETHLHVQTFNIMSIFIVNKILIFLYLPITHYYELVTGMHTVNYSRDMFYTSVTVEKRCRRYSVIGSVRLWVSESVRHENLVNIICQKPMKGISPNLGHRCTWVCRYADYIWGQKVKGQGRSRQWPEKRGHTISS